jgi:hypothetical protein
VSIGETALIFVGIPLAIILVFAFFIWVPGWARKPRYRPDQPWEFEPVWYSPHPKALEGPLADAVADQTDDSGSGAPALTARPTLALGAGAASSKPGLKLTTARGGAHGDW